jgi:Uma2 family endonuclease
MTRRAVQDEKISLHDFLTLEMNAPEGERWELIDGFIWRMMAGGTRAHNVIVQNIAQSTRSKLRARNSHCRPYSENLMTISEELDLAAYPDVVIDCGKQALTATNTTTPVVLFEVLSPGTRQKDAHRKAPRYRQIPTVEAVVLVEQDSMAVEIHRRSGDVFVIEEHASPDDVVRLPFLGIELTLAEIYDEALA